MLEKLNDQIMTLQEFYDNYEKIINDDLIEHSVLIDQTSTIIKEYAGKKPEKHQKEEITKASKKIHDLLTEINKKIALSEKLAQAPSPPNYDFGGKKGWNKEGSLEEKMAQIKKLKQMLLEQILRDKKHLETLEKKSAKKKNQVDSGYKKKPSWKDEEQKRKETEKQNKTDEAERIQKEEQARKQQEEPETHRQFQEAENKRLGEERRKKREENERLRKEAEKKQKLEEKEKKEIARKQNEEMFQKKDEARKHLNSLKQLNKELADLKLNKVLTKLGAYCDKEINVLTTTLVENYEKLVAAPNYEKFEGLLKETHSFPAHIEMMKKKIDAINRCIATINHHDKQLSTLKGQIESIKIDENSKKLNTYKEKLTNFTYIINSNLDESPEDLEETRTNFDNVLNSTHAELCTAIRKDSNTLVEKIKAKFETTFADLKNFEKLLKDNNTLGVDDLLIENYKLCNTGLNSIKVKFGEIITTKLSETDLKQRNELNSLSENLDRLSKSINEYKNKTDLQIEEKVAGERKKALAVEINLHKISIDLNSLKDCKDELNKPLRGLETAIKELFKDHASLEEIKNKLLDLTEIGNKGAFDIEAIKETSKKLNQNLIDFLEKPELKIETALRKNLEQINIHQTEIKRLTEAHNADFVSKKFDNKLKEYQQKVLTYTNMLLMTLNTDDDSTTLATELEKLYNDNQHLNTLKDDLKHQALHPIRGEILIKLQENLTKIDTLLTNEDITKYIKQKLEYFKIKLKRNLRNFPNSLNEKDTKKLELLNQKCNEYIALSDFIDKFEEYKKNQIDLNIKGINDNLNRNYKKGFKIEKESINATADNLIEKKEHLKIIKDNIDKPEDLKRLIEEYKTNHKKDFEIFQKQANILSAKMAIYDKLVEAPGGVAPNGAEIKNLGKLLNRLESFEKSLDKNNPINFEEFNNFENFNKKKEACSEIQKKLLAYKTFLLDQSNLTDKQLQDATELTKGLELANNLLTGNGPLNQFKKDGRVVIYGPRPEEIIPHGKESLDDAIERFLSVSCSLPTEKNNNPAKIVSDKNLEAYNKREIKNALDKTKHARGNLMQLDLNLYTMDIKGKKTPIGIEYDRVNLATVSRIEDDKNEFVTLVHTNFLSELSSTYGEIEKLRKKIDTLRKEIETLKTGTLTKEKEKENKGKIATLELQIKSLERPPGLARSPDGVLPNEKFLIIARQLLYNHISESGNSNGHIQIEGDFYAEFGEFAPDVIESILLIAQYRKNVLGWKGTITNNTIPLVQMPAYKSLVAGKQAEINDTFKFTKKRSEAENKPLAASLPDDENEKEKAFIKLIQDSADNGPFSNEKIELINCGIDYSNYEGTEKYYSKSSKG